MDRTIWKMYLVILGFSFICVFSPFLIIVSLSCTQSNLTSLKSIMIIVFWDPENVPICLISNETFSIPCKILLLLEAGGTEWLSISRWPSAIVLPRISLSILLLIWSWWSLFRWWSLPECLPRQQVETCLRDGRKDIRDTVSPTVRSLHARNTRRLSGPHRRMCRRW